MSAISNTIGKISNHNYGGYVNSTNTQKQADDDTVQSLAETKQSKNQATVYAVSYHNATEFYDSTGTSTGDDDQSDWDLYYQNQQTYTKRETMITMADSKHISIVV